TTSTEIVAACALLRLRDADRDSSGGESKYDSFFDCHSRRSCIGREAAAGTALFLARGGCAHGRATTRNLFPAVTALHRAVTLFQSPMNSSLARPPGP